MTIEELKKDRHWLTGYTGTERVIALIDAEIERQSVTQEEIDEAIKNFESLLDYTTDENSLQKYRNHYGGELPTYKLKEIRDVKVAICALRAYRKPELYCPNCGRKLEVF